MIDSTDIDRLGTAAEELSAMLNEDELRDASLLVFANKQDQPGAKGAGEISEALRLGELRDRNWSIVACSAIDGSGVEEGMDWLVVSASAVEDLEQHNSNVLLMLRIANYQFGSLIPVACMHQIPLTVLQDATGPSITPNSSGTGLVCLNVWLNMYDKYW